MKSVERTSPPAHDAGGDISGVTGVCQRWLAGGRIFRLTVGVPMTEEAKAELTGGVPGMLAPQKIREIGGTWESKQFGDITCTTMVVPSNHSLDATTCAGVTTPLFYGDGFDGTASVVKQPLRFTLQITAGPEGLVSIDAVHALAEKVLARMP